MDRITPLAKALADDTRVRLLQAVSSQGALCCGELARALCVSQATITHHLRILAEVRLVETTRDGPFTRVRACSEGVDALRRALNVLAPVAAPPSLGASAAGPASQHPQAAGDVTPPCLTDGGAA